MAINKKNYIGIKYTPRDFNSYTELERLGHCIITADPKSFIKNDATGTIQNQIEIQCQEPFVLKIKGKEQYTGPNNMIGQKPYETIITQNILFNGTPNLNDSNNKLYITECNSGLLKSQCYQDKQLKGSFGGIDKSTQQNNNQTFIEPYQDQIQLLTVPRYRIGDYNIQGYTIDGYTSTNLEKHGYNYDTNILKDYELAKNSQYGNFIPYPTILYNNHGLSYPKLYVDQIRTDKNIINVYNLDNKCLLTINYIDTLEHPVSEFICYDFEPQSFEFPCGIKTELEEQPSPSSNEKDKFYALKYNFEILKKDLEGNDEQSQYSISNLLNASAEIKPYGELIISKKDIKIGIEFNQLYNTLPDDYKSGGGGQFTNHKSFWKSGSDYIQYSYTLSNKLFMTIKNVPYIEINDLLYMRCHHSIDSYERLDPKQHSASGGSGTSEFDWHEAQLVLGNISWKTQFDTILGIAPICKMQGGANDYIKIRSKQNFLSTLGPLDKAYPHNDVQITNTPLDDGLPKSNDDTAVTVVSTNNPDFHAAYFNFQQKIQKNLYNTGTTIVAWNHPGSIYYGGAIISPVLVQLRINNIDYGKAKIIYGANALIIDSTMETEQSHSHSISGTLHYIPSTKSIYSEQDNNGQPLGNIKIEGLEVKY